MRASAALAFAGTPGAPARLMYSALYRGRRDPSYRGSDEASITIWQYPTRAWARYETRHLSGLAERAVGEQRVLDSPGPDCFWLSDDKMIRVSGQPVEREALLKAYLAKYPSDIEPSFPLFSKRSTP